MFPNKSDGNQMKQLIATVFMYIENIFNVIRTIWITKYHQHYFEEYIIKR